MFRPIKWAAIAAVLASPALATEAPSITAADFAACKAAADQPICLLRLSARDPRRDGFDADMAIGYAPQVIAAVGPVASAPTDSFRDRLSAPARAAVLALRADISGAAPEQALAPIRAMQAGAANVPNSAEDAKYEARRRIEAYQKLWDAGYGEYPLPQAHRPSKALTMAVLQAWRTDLAKSGDDFDAERLADAYRALGDAATADAIRPRKPEDSFRPLLDAGKVEEAAAILDQTAAAEDLSTKEGRFEAAARNFFDAGARAEIMRKAVETGRVDFAVGMAKSVLEKWLNGPGKDPEAAAQAHTGAQLLIAPALVLVAEKAPRADAIGWVERFDAAGRDKAIPTSQISALAAMRAWLSLGETGRAKGLMAFWTPDIDAAIKVCKAGDFKTCARQPGALIPIVLKSQPLDTPWRELLPMSDRQPGTDKLLAGGQAGIDTRLKQVKDLWDRQAMLLECASRAEADDLALAVYCARKLASEPGVEPRVVLPGMGPLRPERVSAILLLARTAARKHDDKTSAEMVDLAFDLAARNPQETVGPSGLLEDIAVAELRAQGRL